MKKSSNTSDPFNTRRCDSIEGYDCLEELALNLRWCWTHRTDKVWKALDAQLWEMTHNPWIVLQTVSRDRVEEVLRDQEFCTTIHELAQAFRSEETSLAWFQQHYAATSLKCLAYFSMEFMLTEGLPIYSGYYVSTAGAFASVKKRLN